jgi:hypothetical protein
MTDKCKHTIQYRLLRHENRLCYFSWSVYPTRKPVILRKQATEKLAQNISCWLLASTGLEEVEGNHRGMRLVYCLL